MRLNIFRGGPVIYALIYHLKESDRERERECRILTDNFNGRSFISFLRKDYSFGEELGSVVFISIRDPIEIYKKCKWTGGEVW